ncbi:MAG: GntR family transcriptional regulator [Burkholderiales bacterium]|nr:GntR family transcriptional regulator [Burkholderiales bacterium]
MTTSLKHRTLSSAVVDDLRHAILEGSYPPGTPLKQDALAATYDISRIPVREALFQLEDEGLVEIQPHKGAVVKALSQAEIDEVFDLRVLLERRLLADAIPKMAAADFARIASLQKAFDDIVASGDLSGSGNANAQFHLALYAAANLPRTSGIVAGLLQTSVRYTRLQLSAARALAKAGREHRELAALCRKRDVDAACSLLVAHIEGVRKDLSGVLRRKFA